MVADVVSLHESIEIECRVLELGLEGLAHIDHRLGSPLQPVGESLHRADGSFAVREHEQQLDSVVADRLSQVRSQVLLQVSPSFTWP